VSDGVRVLLWRHGRTAHNHARIWQGQTDTPLDDVGREQAARAAQVLAAGLDPLTTRLVCSDLRRAADTAAALGRLVGLDPLPDKRLREVDAGEWEGLSRDDIVARGMVDDLAAWRRGDDVRVGRTGERRSEVGRRGAAAILDHVGQVPRRGTLVVAAHGGVLRGATLALLGVDPDRWSLLSGLSNCHWAELLRETHDRGTPQERVTWKLVSYNLGVPAPV
jgi:glucosyl-3-phosphoglycerate phosphatase